MDYAFFEKLANTYQIPILDVLFIALNRYGILADTQENRLRFKVRFTDHSPETFYLALCLNTYDSPFSLRDNSIYLGSSKIADIFDIEKDTCDSTYFRRNKTELTLNSNLRSQCKGCTFCATYKLAADDVKLTSEDRLRDYIKCLLITNHIEDLSHLVRVTVCTGCFESETELVEHLVMVRKVLAEFQFTKRLRYIGAQLQSASAFERISKAGGPFSLSFTVECFSGREKILRKKKALGLREICKVLDVAHASGAATNILYILGFDSLSVLKENFMELKGHLDRYPIIQVFQNFTKEQESARIDEARALDYYLSARNILEDVFADFQARPRSWENYRGLWYTTYQNKKHCCIRI